jgi:LysR family transcriptional regulator, benzoate and cis,cis-muconate-responsive activator of ben and cat genes
MPFRYGGEMELRHLRYFVIVAEEQNVTRAAERLHVSQPPLSRQIHDLEQELGVELFKRTAKSLALTEAGKIFLIEARAVLLRVDKAVETVRTVAFGDRGQLRVGYSPSLTAEILPKALRTFERDRPGVRVSLHDLSSEECADRLTAKKLDLALTVRLSAARMRGLSFEKLISYPLCCAVGASHPLAKKRVVTLAQIRKEKFIIYSREDYPEYYDWIAGFFKDKPFSPCQVEEHDGATGLIAAVEAGRGVAIVATSMKCMAGPRLRLIPLQPAIGQAVVGALTVAPLSPVAESFLAALKVAAKE